MTAPNHTLHEGLAPYIPRVTVNGQTWQPDPTVVLREVAVAACRAGIQPSAKALAHKEAGRLLDPGYLDMETGWARLDDGQMYVAAHTPMSGITGEMIDWWFSWHDTDQAYLLWHPRDHVSASWKHPVDRTLPVREQYIGNTSEIV